MPIPRLRKNTIGVEAIAEANVLYLRNLENWVYAFIQRDEGEGDEKIANLRLSYEKAIRANIEYHELMAKLHDEARNDDLAALHTVIAIAYRTFIQD